MTEVLTVFTIVFVAFYAFFSGIFLMGCRVARMSWTKSSLEAALWPIALIYEAVKSSEKKS